jgi:hypothetical protein
MQLIALKFWQELQDSPVPTMHSNPVGGKPTYSRESEGVYWITWDFNALEPFEPQVVPSTEYRVFLDGIERVVSVEPYLYNSIKVIVKDKDTMAPVECNGALNIQIMLFNKALVTALNS